MAGGVPALQAPSATAAAASHVSTAGVCDGAAAAARPRRRAPRAARTRRSTPAALGGALRQQAERSVLLDATRRPIRVVEYAEGAGGGRVGGGEVPSRRYLVTHNDLTGRVQVAVGRDGALPALSGATYARMLRDEVHVWWQQGAEMRAEGFAAERGNGMDFVEGGAASFAEGVVCAGMAVEADGGGGGGGVAVVVRDRPVEQRARPLELHLRCSLTGTTMGRALASAGEGRSVRAPIARLLARAAAASAAALRKEVFREHMPLVVAAVAAAAEEDTTLRPELLDARVVVHYGADGGVDEYPSVREAAALGTEWLQQDEAQERRAAALFLLLAAAGVTAGAYVSSSGAV